MLYLLVVVLGGAIGFGSARLLARRAKPPQQSTEALKLKAEVDEWKSRWSNAVNLLGFNGQLTDEQVSTIMPPEKLQAQTSTPLPRGTGHTANRRDIEIARAVKGLPPADNLEGMHTADQRDVRVARIKYGTEQ